MKRLTSKPASVYLTCLLLLCGLSQQVIAWPCYPPCTGCCKCVNGSCVNGSCSGCCNCVSCNCNDKDYKCDEANCEECEDCDCVYQCDPETEVCCNGTCCDKVWTKETIGPIDESCGSCNNSTGYCAGMIIDSQGYEKCLNVGVGQGGEHCQCNETMQVVGYIYLCNENWDISKMIWCLLQGAWCAAECYLFMDPAGCANCLAGMDCGAGFMDICDFVEECYPFDDALNEIQDLVFTGFDC